MQSALKAETNTSADCSSCSRAERHRAAIEPTCHDAHMLSAKCPKIKNKTHRPNARAAPVARRVGTIGWPPRPHATMLTCYVPSAPQRTSARLARSRPEASFTYCKELIVGCDATCAHDTCRHTCGTCHSMSGYARQERARGCVCLRRSRACARLLCVSRMRLLLARQPSRKFMAVQTVVPQGQSAG